MTKEQYEKLKEWIEDLIEDKLPNSGQNETTRRYRTEKELDKLMGFGE